MFIMGLVLVVIIGIQISAALTISDARVRQEATALGNEAMEQMRSIPWNVLSKGLASNFESISGGDPYVSSGNLEVDNETVPLVVALATQDQNLAQPWPPLFSDTGSNKQVRVDASNLATTYTVRAYVTEGVSGGDTTRGMAVVVEWTNHRGQTEHTTLRSTAYRGGGCGNLDTQPYLGACQALLDSSASSGSIVTSVTASQVDGTPIPLLGPLSSNALYSASVRTAGVAASASSQQVTIVQGVAQYGGSTVDDNLGTTQPADMGWDNGYSFQVATASDDSAFSNLPSSDSGSYVPTSIDEDERYVNDGGHDVSFQALSDFLRPSTFTADAGGACRSGIPLNQPCAYATIADYPVMTGGSGYILMYVNDNPLRLSRRISDLGAGANTEHAWAARFNTSAGTLSDVGCGVLTGEGCVSAGADRIMATLAIGTVIGGPTSGKWDGMADLGLVLVEGASGCTNGLYESVMVQRGASQQATVPNPTRCGQIRYWNGSAYATWNLQTVPNGVHDTTPVTWTSGNYSITASANITVTAPAIIPSGPSGCATDACVIFADAGGITITATYVISWPAATYVVTSVTTINPPSATASYKAAPDAT